MQELQGRVLRYPALPPVRQKPDASSYDATNDTTDGGAESSDCEPPATPTITGLREAAQCAPQHGERHAQRRATDQ